MLEYLNAKYLNYKSQLSRDGFPSYQQTRGKFLATNFAINLT